MNIGICNICKENKPLVRAHIVPRSLLMISKNEPLIEFSKSGYPKKSPKGIYDENILCSSCDRVLGKLDQKCKAFFDSIQVIYKDNMQYEYKTDDYKVIKLCLLSILYRSNITTRKEFKVDLGEKYSNLLFHIIKDYVDNQQLHNDIEKFDIIMFKYNPTEGNSHKLFDSPFKRRIAGLVFYKFIFAGYEIFFKVDNQKIANKDLKEFVFNKNNGYIPATILDKNNLKQFLFSNPKTNKFIRTKLTAN